MATTWNPLILSQKNFPRRLDHRIRNYIHLSRFWQLLSKILRQDREISSFLSKNFWKIRLAFSPRFARRYLFKVLLVVSTSHVLSFSFGGEALSRAEPPAGPPKLNLLQISRKECDFSASWPRPGILSFSARKIFPDVSITGSETTYIYLDFDSFSAKSLDRIVRYPHFCPKIFGKSA